MDSYTVDKSKLVGDKYLRNIKSYYIHVDNYPDINHLLSIAKANTCMTLNKEFAEIDGDNKSKVKILTISGKAHIKNMPKLTEIRCCEYASEIIIENCKLLRQMYIGTAGKVIVRGKKKLEIIFDEVDEFDIHQAAFLRPRKPLTKYYDNVYKIKIYIGSQEKLDEYHHESLNVNVLKVYAHIHFEVINSEVKTLDQLDFTRFKLDRVTTFRCNVESVFEENALKKVISWTGPPRVNHPIPIMPSLKFLFIEGKESEVYEKSNLYKNILFNSNHFRFEIKYKHTFDKIKMAELAML